MHNHNTLTIPNTFVADECEVFDVESRVCVLVGTLTYAETWVAAQYDRHAYTIVKLHS